MTGSSYKYPKGRVMAAGYFFHRSLFESVVRERVILLWNRDSKLYRNDLGFFLIQSQIKAEFVDSCLGSPLIDQGTVLSNVVFTDTSRGKTSVSGKELIIVLAGEVHCIELNQSLLFELSQWVDISDFEFVDTSSLGLVHVPIAIAEARKKSVREAMGQSAPNSSHELNRTISRLQEVAKGSNDHAYHRAGLSTLFARIRRAFSLGRDKRDAGAEMARPNYSNDGSLAQRPGLIKRLSQAFAEYLMGSALGRAIGRSQAKHVQKMMDQFEDGNIDEALKNAVPLANLRDALQAKSASLGLSGRSLPSSIQPYRVTGSSLIGMELNLLEKLRDIYEKAFSALDRSGDHAKAAFVLAELLRDTERAVSYLEKHNELELAAELAEGQRLAPHRIVRQWVLAGNIERAIEIAIISGCFEEAITLLQKSHPETADDLRWRCAILHHQAGDISSAVDIAWPLTKHRETVVDWMKASIDLGGELGARHLVRLAIFDPKNFENYVELIDRLFKDSENAVELALLDEISRYPDEKPNRRVASIAARFYLVAVSKGRFAFDRKRWDSLCRIAEDLTLRADVRGLPLSIIESHKKSQEVMKNHTLASGNGRRALDCVALGREFVLVCFGESGLELWSARGQLVSQYSIPCHRIVVSDNGNKALLLAQRSDYKIVHTFDLSSRSVSHWLDIKVDCWSNTYDGITWVIANSNQILVLDVLCSTLKSIWSVKELPGIVTSINRNKEVFSVCLSDQAKFEVWVYQLPNLYLKERSPHSIQQLEDFHPIALNESGEVVGCNNNQPAELGLYVAGSNVKWLSMPEDIDIDRLYAFNGYLFVVSKDIEMTYVDMFPIERKQLLPSRLSITYEIIVDINIRVSSNGFMLNSSDGRVVIIDAISLTIGTDILLN